ncbi:MAG: IS630 family transposase [Flavisolibacter sp.]|nr:IS630 family transposase [Flavisolibacter sp.]
MRPKGKCDEALDEVRTAALSLLEQQSEAGNIDLLYADESRVSEQGYVPYAWQFKDEQMAIEASKGKGLNCFAMLSRSNELIYQTTSQSITADFVIEQLEAFSFRLQKPTVVVLDNAKAHTAAKVKACLQGWQSRGLYLFYLPPYCPHLNITERLWKELKGRWLRAKDYLTTDTLFYAVTLALAAVGKNLYIHFCNVKL